MMRQVSEIHAVMIELRAAIIPAMEAIQSGGLMSALMGGGRNRAGR